MKMNSRAKQEKSVVDIQTDFAVYSFDETEIKSIRLLK